MDLSVGGLLRSSSIANDLPQLGAHAAECPTSRPHLEEWLLQPLHESQLADSQPADWMAQSRTH